MIDDADVPDFKPVDRPLRGVTSRGFCIRNLEGGHKALEDLGFIVIEISIVAFQRARSSAEAAEVEAHLTLRRCALARETPLPTRRHAMAAMV
jgi:hypothetical protein